MVIRSLEECDAFYAEVHKLFEEMKARHGCFVVFDLHAYNFRRAGSDALPEDPKFNPEINVGTGTMDRQYWARVVDRFIDDLTAFDFLGRQLDVRENVKFFGRQFPGWVHSHYPKVACVIAVEFNNPQANRLGEGFKECGK